MRLIERYIFRRTFVYSAGSLAALVLIVWIVQALSRIDIVKTSATAAGNVFWIAFMLMPSLAAGVLPFAVLIGAVQTLNALNTDSERAVIAAAGASPRVVARPIVAVGLIAAALVLFNSHVVGPAASRAFQNGLRSINADAITLFLQPGRFERIQSDVVVSIGESQGSTVRSLFISDQRDPAVDLSYFAREARIVEENDESVLLLYDGQLHRRNKADGTTSVIEFQTYAFDLAELRPAAGNDWIRSSERRTGELLSPDLNDPSYQRRPLAFSEELAQRMTDWLYPIAFALWSLVVAGHARTNRQGPGIAMALGLTGALVLKALGFVSTSLIGESARYVPLTYLLPLSAIALNCVLIARDVNPAELPGVKAAARAAASLGAVLARLPVLKLLAPQRTNA
ncbi:LptF/LptG family permease [Aurantimonas sp. Leaf443]|uniref:LptF/LptG family permease n=1 Tax=Aurantimonas sp. Leaf443 TaxID=1736378 RepID=UPI0006F5BAF5|nr:LptF/LptG family permease [Aurantimonas sp. Leaf443]KQT88404.1 permease [Aurantimonas sp. Leaf443]